MCGILGVISLENKKIHSDTIDKIRFAQANLIHRGPDYQGLVNLGNISLAHNRLSIINLNSSSNQPFTDNEKDYLVFNGEIYNYKELGKKHGLTEPINSDTAVLFQLLKRSINNINQLNGMFAFGYLDSNQNRFYLVRDKYGIKPLYYAFEEGNLIFASECKAVRDIISETSIDFKGLNEWSYFGNPLGKHSFFEQILKVLPGHYLEIDLNTKTVESKQYYKFPTSKNPTFSTPDLENKLENLVEQAVHRQLVSDVDIGVFLSGGIDSSAITKIAANTLGSKLRTFTARFDFVDNSADLKIAQQFTQELGIEHEIIDVNSNDLIEVINTLVAHHDSPFADAANIPLYLMSQKVSEEVKVVLQGDGGDELFCGYKRYGTLSKYQTFLRQKPIRDMLYNTSKLMFNVKSKRNQRVKRYLAALGANKEHELFAKLLTTDSNFNYTKSYFSEFLLQKVENFDESKRYKDVLSSCPNDLSLVEKMLYIDSQIILPDTFFEKVDRSTMASSIEVRVPFLDDELVDFAASIPHQQLMGDNHKQKYLLRKVLSRKLPDYIINAPKKGFSVPYENWLKNDLVDYFKTLLNKEYSQRYLDVAKVEKTFSEYRKGLGNHGFILWKILLLLVWVNKNKGIL